MVETIFSSFCITVQEEKDRSNGFLDDFLRYSSLDIDKNYDENTLKTEFCERFKQLSLAEILIVITYSIKSVGNSFLEVIKIIF